MKKSKLRIVLIRTEGPRNLGSVARAMGNFDFKDLVLVDPMASREHAEAKEMAVANYPILQEATVTQDLPSALADCHWTVGFTRRAGRQRKQFLPFSALALEVHKRIDGNQRVAFVFGPEQSGFTTEDANTCHRLVQIPTGPKYPSINLAMSVMLSLFELVRNEPAGEMSFVPIPAPHQEIEAMHGHIQEVLEAVRFFDAQNRARVPSILRRLLNRAEPTRQEVRIVRGLCRNVLNRLKKP